jgi:hypothetical protein
MFIGLNKAMSVSELRNRLANAPDQEAKVFLIVESTTSPLIDVSVDNLISRRVSNPDESDLNPVIILTGY